MSGRNFNIYHSIDEDKDIKEKSQPLDYFFQNKILYNFQRNYPKINYNDLSQLLNRKLSYPKNIKQEEYLKLRGIIKYIIQSSLSHTLHNQKRQIDNIINDILKEIHEKDIFLDKELEYIQYNNRRKNIQYRNIENSKDIIELSQDYNIIFKIYKDFLHESSQGQTRLGIILDEIASEVQISNQESNYKALQKTIHHEISKEVEYYTIGEMMKKFYVSDKENIIPKREWCKNALSYISQSFLYREKKYPQGRDKYFGPYIDELLQKRDSYIDLEAHKIVLNGFSNNEHLEKIDFIDKSNLILFENRCKSIIAGDCRKEYTLGKDIIRELREHTIRLR